jgi:ABC-type polar amino acid transport system ATPase subunit
VNAGLWDWGYARENFPTLLDGLRAIAMRPRILLFDEVTSGLDPELVGEVLDVLRELAAEGGAGEGEERTMLIVTHQMRFAREIADRVVFLENGRIVEAWTPEAIFSAPREALTREFLHSVLDAV